MKSNILIMDKFRKRKIKILKETPRNLTGHFRKDKLDGFFLPLLNNEENYENQNKANR